MLRMLWLTLLFAWLITNITIIDNDHSITLHYQDAQRAIQHPWRTNQSYLDYTPKYEYKFGKDVRSATMNEFVRRVRNVSDIYQKYEFEEWIPVRRKSPYSHHRYCPQDWFPGWSVGNGIAFKYNSKWYVLFYESRALRVEPLNLSEFITLTTLSTLSTSPMMTFGGLVHGLSKDENVRKLWDEMMFEMHYVRKAEPKSISIPLFEEEWHHQLYLNI